MEALRLRERERDYQKEPTKKQKSVADLEAQLLQLQFDDSESAARKRRELEEQLAQLREELEEYQHDRSVELQEDALNQALDEFTKAQNDKLSLLEREWELQQEAHEERLSQIEREWELEKEAHEQRLADMEQEWERRTEEHERHLSQLQREHEQWQAYYDTEMERLSEKAERFNEQHQNRLAAMDREYEASKAKLEKEIKNLQDAANDEVAIRKKAIDLIEKRSDEFFEALIEWNKKYGTGVRADVENAWQRAYAVLDLFKGKELDVQAVLERLQSDMYRFEQATKRAGEAMRMLAYYSQQVRSGGGSVYHNGGHVSQGSPVAQHSGAALASNERQVIVQEGKTILPNANRTRAVQLMANYIHESARRQHGYESALKRCSECGAEFRSGRSWGTRWRY